MKSGVRLSSVCRPREKGRSSSSKIFCACNSRDLPDRDLRRLVTALARSTNKSTEENPSRIRGSVKISSIDLNIAYSHARRSSSLFPGASFLALGNRLTVSAIITSPSGNSTFQWFGISLAVKEHGRSAVTGFARISVAPTGE